MEAKTYIGGFLPNPKAPLLQKPSNLSLYQPKNWIFFKPNFASKLVAQRVAVTGVNKENVDRLVALGVDTVLGTRRKKLAVFVSGGGSNLKSIHQACVDGGVHGDVAVVVTNNSDCGGAVFAREKGIPLILFPKTSSLPNGLSPNDLVTALRKFEVDFIILAGYLKLLPLELVKAYPRSIVNIHPSLLPAFGGKGYYGMKVHKAVIVSGARYSGPTVHFVDEHYDTGRILAQSVVPVLANDTAEDLAARVLSEEHRLYVEVTSALCEDRIVWREDGVPLIQSKDNPKQYY